VSDRGVVGSKRNEKSNLSSNHIREKRMLKRFAEYLVRLSFSKYWHHLLFQRPKLLERTNYVIGGFSLARFSYALRTKQRKCLAASSSSYSQERSPGAKLPNLDRGPEESYAMSDLMDFGFDLSTPRSSIKIRELRLTAERSFGRRSVLSSRLHCEARGSTRKFFQ
jgi:hypothetical protein